VSFRQVKLGLDANPKSIVYFMTEISHDIQKKIVMIDSGY